MHGNGAFNADYANDYGAIGFGFCLQGEYSVTFNANGGTGTMPNQSVPNNVATSLNSCTFDRDEYNFAGWNTKADGTGTSYAEKEAVTNLGNITLYAQWKPANAKYAVQIYGINQDVDENNNPLGLTFGPATQEDCNNAYITHRYEETSAGSGQYYVKIVKHTVAVNGTETTSEDFLYANGGTTIKVTRTEAEKNKYDINMHSMTWEEIAAVQDKTDFLDCMLCGDTKSVKLSLNSTIGTGETFNQYGDGAGMLAFAIRQYYIMWNPAFNNEQPERNNSAATNGGSLGSNGKDAGGYSSSHIRATIIGANSKTDVTYAGDVNLTADNCLYSCLPSNLKNVITAKKVKYVTGDQADYVINDDICDKIWLFSKREVYGSGQFSGETAEGLGVNGDGYDKFGNPNSRSYMASYTNEDADQRLCSSEYGSFDMWWLRSPGLDWDGSACNIDSSGYIAGFIPAIDLALAFGFCIR